MVNVVCAVPELMKNHHFLDGIILEEPEGPNYFLVGGPYANYNQPLIKPTAKGSSNEIE